MEMNEFRSKIEHLVNSCSMENGSDTPDYILAEYLTTCLMAFDRATNRRDVSAGRKTPTSESSLNKPAVIGRSEQFICPDCNKPEKEYKDGLCEMCHKWYTS